jgi:hypothetical protein
MAAKAFRNENRQKMRFWLEPHFWNFEAETMSFKFYRSVHSGSTAVRCCRTSWGKSRRRSGSRWCPTPSRGPHSSGLTGTSWTKAEMQGNVLASGTNVFMLKYFWHKN